MYTKKMFGWMMCASGWARDYEDTDGQTMMVHVSYFQVMLIKHPSEDRYVTSKEYYADQESYIANEKELSYPLVVRDGVDAFSVSQLLNVMFTPQQAEEIVTAYLHLGHFNLPPEELQKLYLAHFSTVLQRWSRLNKDIELLQAQQTHLAKTEAEKQAVREELRSLKGESKAYTTLYTLFSEELHQSFEKTAKEAIAKGVHTLNYSYDDTFQ